MLASTRALDLHELAEDELLLALPLVPRPRAVRIRCFRLAMMAASAPPVAEPGHP